jgi:hypothetical protein
MQLNRVCAKPGETRPKEAKATTARNLHRLLRLMIDGNGSRLHAIRQADSECKPRKPVTVVLELGGDMRSNGIKQSPAASGSAYTYWKATNNSEFYLGYDGFWGSTSSNLSTLHEGTLGSVIRLYGGPIDVNSITRLTELHRGLYLRTEYKTSWETTATPSSQRVDASLGWAAMSGPWTINLQLGKSILLRGPELNEANLASTVEISYALLPTLDLVISANPLLQRSKEDGRLNSVFTFALYNRF